MKIICVLYIALLSMNQLVHAGTGDGQVKIEHVGKWNDKNLVFFYTTNHINTPGCNTYDGRWVLELSEPLGKSQYSLLLSAQASGKEVKVSGTSTCDLFSNSESVQWVGFPLN